MSILDQSINPFMYRTFSSKGIKVRYFGIKHKISRTQICFTGLHWKLSLIVKLVYKYGRNSGKFHTVYYSSMLLLRYMYWEIKMWLKLKNLRLQRKCTWIKYDVAEKTIFFKTLLELDRKCKVFLMTHLNYTKERCVVGNMMCLSFWWSNMDSIAKAI